MGYTIRKVIAVHGKSKLSQVSEKKTDSPLTPIGVNHTAASPASGVSYSQGCDKPPERSMATVSPMAPWTSKRSLLLLVMKVDKCLSVALRTKDTAKHNDLSEQAGVPKVPQDSAIVGKTCGVAGLCENPPVEYQTAMVLDKKTWLKEILCSKEMVESLVLRM